MIAQSFCPHDFGTEIVQPLLHVAVLLAYMVFGYLLATVFVRRRLVV